MNKCEHCPYWYKDFDADSDSVNYPSCHYVDEDEYAPCNDDDRIAQEIEDEEERAEEEKYI